MIEYVIRIKRKARTILSDPWVWKMAWRDARHNMPRLFLFTASLITGIAAVVAIGSLNYSLQNDLDRNAKELLGADLVASGNKKFEPAILAAFDSTRLEQASESEMASMVMFMNNRQSRLVRLVALEGPFPFYGEILTLPEDSYDKMKSGKGYAMLDESLASQYEVSSDDSIKVGNSIFKVSGVVRKFPGSSGILTTFTPSVYISSSELDSTGLVQFGSRVTYRRFFKTTSEGVSEKMEAKLRPMLRKHGHWLETVEGRREDLGEDFQAVYRFFSLLAFIALILGCIGVASSVHIYAREKREEVAVLRCIGSSGWQAFNIYFIQVSILGLLGSLVGATIGVGIQQLVPLVFKDFVPVELEFGVSWRAVIEGLLLGGIVSLLFTILPLVTVRFVPPLAVLRTDFAAARVFSKARLTVIILIVLFPFLTAAWQTKSLMTGAFFSLGIAVALGLLALVALGILFIAKRFFPKGASFVLRHALSNLFRPNNQTQALLVTIGLGAFIIATLNIIQNSLLKQVEFTGNENQSNTILFDIQPSQRDGVVELMKAHELPVNQLVPIVTCRLKEIKGKSVDSLQRDTSDHIPNWALTREYRVTYRDSLHHSEELIEGTLHALRTDTVIRYGRQKIQGSRDSVWVTISEGMQESLEVDLGDSVVFDVQGVPIKAWIAGIRKVDWPKDPPNFIFVFPAGVLEAAPQIWVATTRIDSQPIANKFQQQLVMQYGNVSLIDLRLVLSTINELFSKVALTIRFLALFSIITGLVVLAGAVINSKFARIKENVLLRTVGARTSQITRITLIEYAYLGLFSALTGIILSILSGFLLTQFFFEVGFSVNYLELVWIGSGVTILTVFIGWLNSREVISTPPLQVLRKEG
jgi:putative ABC transport system permease protein